MSPLEALLEARTALAAADANRLQYGSSTFEAPINISAAAARRLVQIAERAIENALGSEEKNEHL